jgi:uncharacterized repeat protein (TIGR01451 family)
MAQSDALIVLAHMGTDDSGAYKGLVTVAQELVEAGKPVDMMIAGHQHQLLDPPVVISGTTIVGAGNYGRNLGDIKVAIDTDTKSLSVVTYTYHLINNTLTANTVISDRVAYWAGQVVTQVNQIVGHTYISLTRNYDDESIMGDLVADSMLWKADQYDDDVVNGSVDIAFTNSGGLRADIEIPDGAALPYTLTWGATFNVLPFANTLFYMDLTGAQVQVLLDQAATLYKGMIQSSGVSFYWYNDGTAWGAYRVMVDGEPLERDKVYRVVTNNFLAGGQDGWVTFADGLNRWDSYFDMQVGLNEYIDTVLGGDIEAGDIPMGRVVRLAPVSVVKEVTPIADVAPGDTVTYTVVLANVSDFAATDLVMTDTLPSEVDFGGWVMQGSASASALMPSPVGDEIVWGPWTVQSGTTITFVFTATLKTGSAYRGTPVINTVEFASDNAGSGSDEAIFNKGSMIFLPLVIRTP